MVPVQVYGPWFAILKSKTSSKFSWFVWLKVNMKQNYLKSLPAPFTVNSPMPQKQSHAGLQEAAQALRRYCIIKFMYSITLPKSKIFSILKNLPPTQRISDTNVFFWSFIRPNFRIISPVYPVRPAQRLPCGWVLLDWKVEKYKIIKSILPLPLAVTRSYVEQICFC